MEGEKSVGSAHLCHPWSLEIKLENLENKKLRNSRSGGRDDTPFSLLGVNDTSKIRKEQVFGCGASKNETRKAQKAGERVRWSVANGVPFREEIIIVALLVLFDGADGRGGFIAVTLQDEEDRKVRSEITKRYGRQRS